MILKVGKMSHYNAVPFVLTGAIFPIFALNLILFLSFSGNKRKNIFLIYCYLKNILRNNLVYFIKLFTFAA